MNRTLGLTVVLALAACGASGGSNNMAGSDMSRADQGQQGGDDSGSGPFIPPGYRLVAFTGDGSEHMYSQAEMVLVPGQDYVAVIETDIGRLVVELHADKAPLTVNSFVFLALEKYFDGIAFHRVIDDFMAQSGDPNTLDVNRSNWGRGGPGYRFDDEFDATLRFDKEGVVAMANSGKNTNGSQFFITFRDTPHLNDKHSIFGRVTEGVARLGNIRRGMPPAAPTRMTSVHIATR